MNIRPIADGDEDGVVDLWEACGLLRPWNAPLDDIALARRTADCEIFIGEDDGKIIASALAGSDGHRGWLYYVAVSTERRGENLGTAMVAHAEAWFRNIGILKVELMIRPENEGVRAFYESIGYVVEPRVVMSRWLIGQDRDYG